MAQATLSLPPLLERVKRIATQETTAILRELGFADLEPHHGPILLSVDEQGARPSAVADAARLTRQFVGQVVSDLVRLGYVEVTGDTRDGRAKLVRVTPRGRAAQLAASEAVARVERDWERRFGPARIHQLRATLEAIAAPDAEEGQHDHRP